MHGGVEHQKFHGRFFFILALLLLLLFLRRRCAGRLAPRPAGLGLSLPPVRHQNPAVPESVEKQGGK